jgi:hypothetical protein
MFPSQRAAFRARSFATLSEAEEENGQSRISIQSELSPRTPRPMRRPLEVTRAVTGIGHKTAFWTVVSGLIRWSPLCIAARIPFSVRQSSHVGRQSFGP